MATQRIGYNAATAWGEQVATFIDLIQQATAIGRRTKAAFDAMNGTPVSYLRMEDELGIDNGRGSDVYDIVNNAVATLNTIGSLAVLDTGK